MLLHDGSPLPVRPVALAVLYYLALEGPTRREALAKLLRAPGVDLHTELAQLEQELPNTWSSSLMTGTELLRLPPELITTVDPRQRDKADPLEGLDDIANEFQAWLEWMRHYLVSSASWGLGAHAVRVAASLEPPYLLFVQPQPGDDVNAFARELAAALGEELRPAPGGEPGLYCPPRPYSDELVQHILHDPHSIYVLEMPPLGDIPAPIQELRKSYPRSHSRLVKLPPLTWNEVSSGPLQGVPFELAARAYLTAQGNPSYLRELQEREHPLTPGARLPVPQHLQQLVQFYLTLLTPHARNSLERLAVHPGPIPDGLLLGFSVKPVLTELKRHRWLAFNSQGSYWYISSDLMRRVIYQSLHDGRRREYHQAAARHFRGVGDEHCAAYHEYLAYASDEELLAFEHPAQEGVRGPEVFGSVWAKHAFDEWLRTRRGDLPANGVAPHSLPRSTVGRGAELRMEPMKDDGAVEAQGAWLTLKRKPVDREPTQISWELPDRPALVRIHGRAYIANPLGCGLSGEATPLEVRFSRLPGRIILAPVGELPPPEDCEIVLPLESDFDYWCLLPAGGYLTVSCAAELALVELEVSAFEPLPDGGGALVEALDLRGANHVVQKEAE